MKRAAVLPPMHYADWFLRHAATRPTTIAIATPKVRLTYAEFHRALHSAAHRLSAANIDAGQTVALCVRNPALHCVLIAALNRLGVVTLSLRRPANENEEIDAPGDLAIDRVLVERPFAGRVPGDAFDVDLDWLKTGEEPTKAWEGAGLRDGDALSHIFTSSGTTGEPKAIGLSTRQIEARLFKRSIGLFAAGRTGSTLCLFGLRTSVGFQTIFGAFWAGGTVFAGFPERVIPAVVARNKIERIEASPAQYREVLRASDPAKSDLSSLRFAVVAGSATPKPLIAAIRSKLCANLIGQYGATEVGMVAYGPLRANDAAGRSGHLVPWIEVEIVDGKGKPVADGAEGQLRFRCEETVRGYLNDAKASSTSFKKGWFYPGDIGTISSQRELTISGRSVERINAGGVKVSPDVIESFVMSHAGVVDCAAFGVPDALGVEQVSVAIVADRAIDLEELRKKCDNRLGLNSPQKFFLVDTLPRNDMGKILRGQLLQAFAAGGARPAPKRSRKR